MRKNFFDPYCVQSWEWEDEGSLDHCRVVSKDDYDDLLAMYQILTLRDQVTDEEVE